MTTLLLCIAKLIVASGLLYGYYALFLRNRRFHRYNRFYLLIAAAVTVSTPFISIPLHLQAQPSTGTALVKTLQVISSGSWAEQETGKGSSAPGGGLSFSEGAGLLYAAGLAICLFGLLRSLVYIAGIRRKYPSERIDNIRFYDTTEPGTPFSFFRLIFWNRQIPFDTKQGQQIFRHELYHVKQRHSSDILFMELLCCIAWFNPFFFMMKKELKAIHEFLADEYAVSQNNRLDYAELLVVHALQQKQAGLLHPFSQHQIKRRIMMITKPNPLRSGWLSRAMVLPLLLVLFSAFAVKLTGPVTGRALIHAGKPVLVMLDAGHGGIDPGAQVPGAPAEKDLALTLVQKVSELAGQYNIQVALTRNSDALPGNTDDIKQALRNRVTMTAEKKADLFVSLHVNISGDNDRPASGFEAYIAARKEDKKAELLASSLLQQLNDVYTTSSHIQQRSEGAIWVLEKSPCPAVLLECGNLHYANDVAFITNKDNQEKIARSILEGIVKYLRTNQ